jgi:hypothetical protein
LRIRWEKERRANDREHSSKKRSALRITESPDNLCDHNSIEKDQERDKETNEPHVNTDVAKGCVHHGNDRRLTVDHVDKELSTISQHIASDCEIGLISIEHSVIEEAWSSSDDRR